MTRQIAHLVLLMAAHVVADLLGGLLGAIQPTLRSHFNLTLQSGVVLITLLGMAGNLFQVVAGYLPAGRKPWTITAGLTAACLIPLIGLLPGHTPYPVLVLLLVAGGAGVAWVHPNGLRGIHHLHLIPPPVSTAVFMVGGFVGFSAGAWISGALVQRFNLPGLLVLIPAGLVMALVIPLSRIRLSVERQPARHETETRPVPALPFPPLLLMGTLAALAASLLTILLPTFLHDAHGFSQEFSGRTVFSFGLGGGLGSLFWGAVAHKRSYPFALRASLLLGLAPLLAYLTLTHLPAAIWLLALASFFLYAAFPLIVTLARHADSTMALNKRMGFIVGGSWGLAALSLIGLTYASRWMNLSLLPILHLSWLLYLLIYIYSLSCFKRKS